jgi:prepilin-type N-terminal cleavage/methylation domain-containing protein
MKKGFTLIELLVVVLIIGILAAVALPKYEMAVMRSRTATMLGLLKNLAEAQEAYYLANGSYAVKVADLDIDLPASCTHVSYSPYDSGQAGELARCDNYFIVDNATAANSVNVNYCPNNNTTWESCSSKRDFQIAFRLKHNTWIGQSNKRYCVRYSSKGEKLCRSFAGLEYRS